MRGKSTLKGDDGTTLSVTRFQLAEVHKVDPDLFKAFEIFRDKGLDFSRFEGEVPNVLVHSTNAEYRNPRHWEVRRYDRRATLDNGIDYTGLVLGEYENPVYANHLAETYFSVTMDGEPMLSEVTWGPKGQKRRFLRIAAQDPQNDNKVICLVKPKPISLAHSLFGKPVEWSMKQVESLSIDAGGTNVSLKAGFAFGIAINADGEALKESARGAVGYDA